MQGFGGYENILTWTLVMFARTCEYAENVDCNFDQVNRISVTLFDKVVLSSRNEFQYGNT